MLFPDTIEVAAGLVFVYLFMSVLATIAREAWEGFVKSRSRTLERGLVELLCEAGPDKARAKAKGGAQDPAHHQRYEILKEFYEHPLIMSLYRGGYTPPAKRSSLTQANNLPSYIPSGHFAFALLDMMAKKGGQGRPGVLNAENILAAAENTPNARVAQMVQFAIHNSGGDLDQARQFLETWYNATMDRVSGWYKHETQTIIFWVSLVACVVLNVNTVVIADTLYRDPTLRKVAVTKAEAYITHKATIPASDDVAVSKSSTVEMSTMNVTTPVPKPEERAAVSVAPDAVTPDAVTPDAMAKDAQAVAPVAVTAPAPVVSAGPIQSDTSNIATKLVNDVQNVTDRRDALADLGLPLGWNAQTLMTMRRLFSFQPAAKPLPVVDKPDVVVTPKPRGLFPDLAVWWDQTWASIKSLWDDALNYYNGAPALGDNSLINAVTAISLIGGWVMTAFAVTLGAPFWFDVLSKLMIVRSTIKPKDGSPGKGSGADALGALAAALTAPTAIAATSYSPRYRSDAQAVAANTQDDDLLFLRTVDPYDRPRDE
jgi:hypothetical protein